MFTAWAETKAEGHLVWPQQVDKICRYQNWIVRMPICVSLWTIYISCRFPSKIKHIPLHKHSSMIKFKKFDIDVILLSDKTFSVLLLYPSYPFLQWFFHSGSCVAVSCHVPLIAFTTLLLFYVLVFRPRGMWDPSSPTRYWTFIPCSIRWSLNHWTVKKVPL